MSSENPQPQPWTMLDVLNYQIRLIDYLEAEKNTLTIVEKAKIECEILTWQRVLQYKQSLLNTSFLSGFCRCILYPADLGAVLNMPFNRPINLFHIL